MSTYEQEVVSVFDEGELNVFHVLKLDSKYYDASLTNAKTFEIRKNDRDFKVGDIINLVEVNPELRDESLGLIGVTGRAHYKVITYILDDAEYLRDGYVCLGLKPLKRRSVE